MHMVEYAITFADVMTGVIGLGIGFMTFLLRRWFDNLNSRMDSTDKKITETNEKLNERIEKLEQEMNAEIKDIREELKSIEKDFPVVYVQRDDFFRSMNGVEQQMRDMNGKMDKLLMQNNSSRS